MGLHSRGRHAAMALLAAILSLGLAGRASAATLEVLVTDAAGAPLADAVVELRGVSAARPAPAISDMAQRGQAFVPHVLVVPLGAEVRFPNYDDTQHHVYSFSPAKTFELELYKGNDAAPVVFDRAGVVELGCNIHDAMRGYIVVSESGAAAVTDSTGRATLAWGPEDAMLHVWHPRQVGAVAPRPIGTGPRAAPLELAVAVEPAPAPVVRGLRNWISQ